MDPDITFTYNDKTYSVSSVAYGLDRIVLPDGTVLAVLSWYEVYPPEPQGFEVVAHVFAGHTPEEIATLVNGAVAQEKSSAIEAD